MKVKLFSLFFIVSVMCLLLISCSDNTTTFSGNPVGDNSQKQYKWIELPKNENPQLEKIFTVSKTIVGSSGGTVSLSGKYTSSTGTISVSSSLVFPRGSFVGTKTITKYVDDALAVSDFYPENTDFIAGKYPTYSITYQGIDVSRFNPNTLIFAYLAPDGTIQKCTYKSITLDVARKKLAVSGAVIPHFSRYGFAD